MKLIMNALYGRFGINPMSTVTTIVNWQDFKKMKRELGDDLITSANAVSRQGILVTYWKIPNELDKDWYPKLAAVQISAAIAASSRIHMSPFASRDDCHYTDTDSVVLKDPLPPELVCNQTLGKFKLECKVKRGVFAAPKSYYIRSHDDVVKIAHKGPARKHVTEQWFEEQLSKDRKPTQVQVRNPFRGAASKTSKSKKLSPGIHSLHPISLVKEIKSIIKTEDGLIPALLSWI
jgi:hypothetical protein